MQIEFRNIHKRYGLLTANNNISFTVCSGTIHGVLGENGAGKSTLMKILAGFCRKTGGDILIDGQEADITSPEKAFRMDIGMLYQDPMDFQNLTVFENFILDGKYGFLLRTKAALKELFRLSDHFGFNLNPNIQVKKLTIGERQQLELIRLFRLGIRGLILDEPTSGISDDQKQSLFAALRKFVENGRCVILVSHKIEDMEALCDRVTILRQGAVNGEMEKPFIREKILEMMFGAIAPPLPRIPLPAGKIILSMEDISAPGGRSGLKDCTAHIKQHEVIGLAGLEGSGQGIFLRCAAGLARPVKGTICLHDVDMKGKNYHHFNRKGITFLPAARLEEGLIGALSLADHFVLGRQQRGFWVDRDRAGAHCRQAIADFSIKAQPATPVQALSGGNQQRLLLSLMDPQACLLLLENPSRGLDVASVHWVWQKLCGASGSRSIVFSSAEIEEILMVADRVLVFFEGRIILDLPSSQASPEILGRAISGKRR